jgi:hypothetical protein
MVHTVSIPWTGQSISYTCYYYDVYFIHSRDIFVKLLDKQFYRSQDIVPVLIRLIVWESKRHESGARL